MPFQKQFQLLACKLLIKDQWKMLVLLKMARQLRWLIYP